MVPLTNFGFGANDVSGTIAPINPRGINMDASFHGTTTVVNRLRLRYSGKDSFQAQLRLAGLLKTTRLHPTGLPPTAILVIRSIADPSPRSLHLNQSTLASSGWEQAITTELDRLAARAVRPARGSVPANAESVIFLDRSELLACLASDWCEGNLVTRWWWQSLFKQGLSREILMEYWQRTPQYVPAALQYLAIKQQAVSFVRNLSDAEVHELWRAVARTFALTSLISPLDEAPLARPALKIREPKREEPEPDGEPKHQPGTDIRAPWAFWTPEVEGASLRPAQQFFLGVTLMLQRAPAKVRATDFQTEVRRWVDAVTAPVTERLVVREAVAAAPAADKKMSRLSAQPSSHSSEHLPVTNPGNALAGDKMQPRLAAPEIRQPRAKDESGFDATESFAVETSELVPQSHSDQKHDPKPEPAVKVKSKASDIAEVVAVAESGAVNTETLVSDAPSDSTEQQNVAELSEGTTTPGEIFSETAQLVEASSEPIPTPAFEIQETETNEEWTETKLGGLFYLINLALFLGLYGDFTSPDQPGLELSIWEFIRLIGKDLLRQKPASQPGPIHRQPSSTNYVPSGALPDGRASALALNYDDDPVWALLARLGQREDDTEAGCGFEPPDEWRISPEWLQPFTGETSRPWRWSVSAERLRLFHPAGFAVLDLPRSPAEESPAAQLERELRVYAGVEFQVSNLELIEPPSELETRNSKLENWLARLLPYLRARLRKALGLTETVEPGPLLCRHCAQVCITPTHVDLFFRLADLPIEIRRSGLDRDPGWVPAAGRFIAFHFE